MTTACEHASILINVFKDASQDMNSGVPLCLVQTHLSVNPTQPKQQQIVPIKEHGNEMHLSNITVRTPTLQHGLTS